MVRQASPEEVKPVFDAAREVQDFFRRSGLKFCIIGGLALQRWGQPRITKDADFTLLCALGDETETIDRVLSQFEARIPDARTFALKARVILIRTASGIPVDIALGALPFEHRCIERASGFDFGPGLRLVTCSAEDLIVLKAFAGRGQDWVDIENVLIRQHRTLDWKLIFVELEPLLALRESADNLAQLRRLRARIEQGQ
jgi:hypothetical protein